VDSSGTEPPEFATGTLRAFVRDWEQAGRCGFKLGELLRYLRVEAEGEAEAVGGLHGGLRATFHGGIDSDESWWIWHTGLNTYGTERATRRPRPICSKRSPGCSMSGRS
jgi:hypothetical protein